MQLKSVRKNYPVDDLGTKSIVVTGGAGLIGSAIIWGLNRRNFNKIWLIDDWSEDSIKSKNVQNLLFNRKLGVDGFRELIRQNSSDLQEINTIFHLGACSSTTETNEDFLHDNNFLYTKELCEWSLNQEVRFIYASSASTYGDGSLGMDDEMEEIENLKPLNPYARSKQKFDLLAKEQKWLDRIVGLKYFNVFGPNEQHKQEMRSLVSKAFEQITLSGEMTLFKSYDSNFADGEQMRDFLYVKDAVDMTIWLAENIDACGIFNLGSGKARTWLDLANSIFSSMQKETQIKFVEMPLYIRDKYQYFTEAKISKLKATGFDNKQHSLEDAVNDYVKNYLEPELHLSLP